MKAKDFVKLHGIDKIVESYSTIADRILKEVPEDQWVWMTEAYGDGENCRTRALEIWAPDEPVRPHQNLFKHLHSDIEKIPDCIQAYVVYIEPGSTVPQHIDDNEGFFVITAVNEVKENWLEISGNIINFDKGQSVGIKPDVQYHGGENISDQHWIFFIVSLKPHPFGDQTLLLE